MRFAARLRLLERPLRQTQKLKVTRVLISRVGLFDWKKVTCTRRSVVPGALLEVVNLHGTAAGLDPNELEAFVAATPIEYGYPRALGQKYGRGRL